VGHTAEVHWAAFSPNGKTLATASEDRTVRLWHVATGQELFALEGHDSPVEYVAFYPDGRRLLTVGRGSDGRNEFYVWSATEEGT
jgi:WD40 repeat protein